MNNRERGGARPAELAFNFASNAFRRFFKSYWVRRTVLIVSVSVSSVRVCPSASVPPPVSVSVSVWVRRTGAHAYDRQADRTAEVQAGRWAGKHTWQIERRGKDRQAEEK
jgi:hypothetical protein